MSITLSCWIVIRNHTKLSLPTYFVLAPFLGLCGLIICAMLQFAGFSSVVLFGDGQRIIRWGVVGFRRLWLDNCIGVLANSSPSTTPESLELLSELSKNAEISFDGSAALSSSWDPFTISTLLMYSVGGSVWNFPLISAVKKDDLIGEQLVFVTALLLSKSNFSTGSCRKMFLFAVCPSGRRIGPLFNFCCLHCVTSSLGGSFSVEVWSSNESHESSECELWPFWTLIMPFAGKRAKYSLILRVDRVAGRDTFPFASSLTFAPPFSIRTPSIFDSFLLGLLRDWSSPSTNTRTLEECVFTAVDAPLIGNFCARGLRPKNITRNMREFELSEEVSFVEKIICCKCLQVKFTSSRLRRVWSDESAEIKRVNAKNWDTSEQNNGAKRTIGKARIEINIEKSETCWSARKPQFHHSRMQQKTEKDIIVFCFTSHSQEMHWTHKWNPLHTKNKNKGK